MNATAGLAVACLLAAAPAAARTLTVGDGRQYGLPSEAIAAAHDGDTILIAPGDYLDCAIVRSNDLTIAGEGAGEGADAVGRAGLTDKVCEGKAILVLRGNNVTIRDLTLRRARAPDANGAGIRVESPDLTVERVRFENDQVGLLSGAGGGRITIRDSVFQGGGVGGEQPKHAIMVGPSALLRVTGSTFADVKGGLISTAAAHSEIADNTFGLGAGNAEEDPASAVLTTAGVLLMERNAIVVGPLAPRTGAAIALWDDAAATLRHNRMTNQTGRHLAFVQDWSWVDPVLQENQIGPGDSLVGSSGVWRHRASNQYHARKVQARALASDAKQLLKRALGR